MASCSSEAIDKAKDELKRLNQHLWNNPELSLEEHKSHDLLCDYLESKGFSVERRYLGIDTAFRARFGSGSPNVCVCCEYDALPDIGHACGHNLIAESAIGAGLGVKAFLEQNQNGGKFTGTLTVMGTPAEEAFGGKVMLIEKGAFKDIDIAVMAHPSPIEVAMPMFLCVCSFEATFKGKAAHAAAFPWEGINALDAAVLGYNNVSALRQQMKPTWRVHGVFKEGGTKPNIIPERAVLNYSVRSETLSETMILKEKVIKCFEGAAMATGCTCEISNDTFLYKDIIHNEVLGKLYADHMKSQGVTDIDLYGALTGSTDMGNVSYEVPSIHPVFKITGSAGLHTREFADVANTTPAHEKTLIVAKAMASTCIDVLQGGEELLKKIQESFKAGIN